MLCVCGHDRGEHSSIAGCLHQQEDATYCPCSTFALDQQAAINAALERPLDMAAFTGDRGLAAGRAARDEGAALAGTGAPAALVADWKAKASKALDQLIEDDAEFSADDVAERAGMPPVPNMLGGLFIAASRQGRIRPVGFTQSTRPAAHARVQRTWIKA